MKRKNEATNNASHHCLSQYLNVVGQPPALGVSVLHREEDIFVGDDRALRDGFYPQWQVAIVMLKIDLIILSLIFHHPRT